MREPETLKELIAYMHWSYERLEDDDGIVMTLTDGDQFHELLKNLEEDYEYIELAKNCE